MLTTRLWLSVTDNEGCTCLIYCIFFVNSNDLIKRNANNCITYLAKDYVSNPKLWYQQIRNTVTCNCYVRRLFARHPKPLTHAWAQDTSASSLKRKLVMRHSLTDLHEKWESDKVRRLLCRVKFPSQMYNLSFQIYRTRTNRDSAFTLIVLAYVQLNTEELFRQNVSLASHHAGKVSWTFTIYANFQWECKCFMWHFCSR